MNIIFAILLSLTAILGSPSQSASVAAQAPVYEFVGDTYEVPTDWVEYELWQADMELTPNVVVALTNELNCGAQASELGLGGCTYTLEDGSYYVTVSPELAWSDGGKHILFHELAHTLGMGECEAEVYAHQFETTPLWSYPACEESPTA